MRAEILRLRSDPQASAMLAGALTRNNATLVNSSIGRQPTNGELTLDISRMQAGDVLPLGV
ncbi:MAG: hypothetical protein WBY77_19515 [Pseudolabrys sp.]